MSHLFFIFIQILEVIVKCDKPLDSYNFQPSTGDYSVERYHIDKKTLTCHSHIFKGFSHNFNSFPTLESCQKQLIFTPEEQLEACNRPKDAGKCEGSLSRWYFDGNKNECARFTYTGCGGNGNVFDSAEDCENTCKPTKTPNSFDCKIEPYIGDKDDVSAIVADLKNKRCITGSVGSKTTRGIFESVSECVDTCIPIEKRVKACSSPPNQPTTCEKDSKYPTLRYYYNKSNQMCEPFYSCEHPFDPSINNFPSLILCQSYCAGGDFQKKRPMSNICELPKDTGTGQLSLDRFYFDGKNCVEFTYRGIGGNENNFKLRKVCSAICS